METEYDEESSGVLIRRSSKVSSSGGEVKTWIMKDAEPSERTCVEDISIRENKELVEGGFSGHLHVMNSSNGFSVTTMPANNTEPHKTQPNAKSEGSEIMALLNIEGEVIDFENEAAGVVKGEKGIHIMAEVKENQASVSEIFMQNSQVGFVRGQGETQMPDDWSRAPENSLSTGKVEEIVRVLKEQQSHDIVCPDCGHCITERVILRKRNTVLQQIPQHGNDQQIPDDGGDACEAYGCLACFSVFFPGATATDGKTHQGEDTDSGVEELPRAIAARKESICDCIPVSIQRVWTILRRPEKTKDQLREPLLPISQEPQVAQIVTEWDIVKSIVYGGLTGSLTSLGVVSSTAGGDAKTLVVIVTGLANLVAGLFVILNNILDLKRNHQDQFEDTIGHSFWFNGSVAIVSYLIFGSLAPITYAFSFRESDDRLYKFIATGAVSLVCISLLALGKARVSKKGNYVRTVILYIVAGFCSAVAGFFAGEFIKKLLEKVGL